MVVCRDFAAAYLQVHFPNTHGGLTPAALVNVRFCIAKGVIFTENEHRSLHQERGASAPRGAAARERNGDQHTLSGVLRIIVLVSA
jgi:hypothetical protein